MAFNVAWNSFKMFHCYKWREVQIIKGLIERLICVTVPLASLNHSSIDCPVVTLPNTISLQPRTSENIVAKRIAHYYMQLISPFVTLSFLNSILKLYIYSLTFSFFCLDGYKAVCCWFVVCRKGLIFPSPRTIMASINFFCFPLKIGRRWGD